jgi:hypothetical protein
MHGVPGAYAPGSAETGPSGLVRVFGGCRDQVLTHLAPLKPALQAWCGCFGGCRDQVLTHLAPLKPALQAWWGVWGCRDQVLTHLALLRSALQAFGGPLRRVLGLCRACACGSGLKGCFPVFQGRNPGNAPFYCGDGSRDHAAPRPEVGQRPDTT